jgi:hypothetical protein
MGDVIDLLAYKERRGAVQGLLIQKQRQLVYSVDPRRLLWYNMPVDRAAFMQLQQRFGNQVLLNFFFPDYDW